MNSNNSDDHDFKLSGSDWLQALEELEGSAPATSLRPRKKVKSLTPLPIATPPKAQSPVPQIVEELQTAIQEELDRIKAFVGAHPYLIAPNVHRMWEDNYRETSVMLARHFERWQQRQDESQD